MSKGRAGIQRALNDDDDAVLSTPPVSPRAPTAAGGRDDDAVMSIPPPAPGPQVQKPEGRGPRTRPAHWDKPRQVPESQAAELFEWNPTAVVRSPSNSWHQQMFGLDEGEGKAPRVYRTGVIIVVAPDFPGPATTLPQYSAVGDVGLGGARGAPAAAPGAAGPGQGPQQTTPPRPEAPMRRDVAPGPVRGPGGSQTALPATHDEVVAAQAANPGSVFRSPNIGWHREGYARDRGQGEAPQVFKVGDIFVIAPAYPLHGVPPLAQPGIPRLVSGDSKRPRPNESQPMPLDGPGGGGPPTETPAGQPGTEPDTKSGRWKPPPGGDRAEQDRRAAQHRIDEVAVQGGVQPDTQKVEPGTSIDARARARAADYTPTYADWKDLKPEVRRARIENIINAQLAREGIPPVRVVFGGKKPGSAEFAAGNWTMALSKQVVDAPGKIDLGTFATLVDNAVHETQHVVTTFRGMRVAIAAKSFSPKVDIPDRIVKAAHDANDLSHPDKDLSKQARKEALEIYEVSVEPDRSTGRKVPVGGVNRDAVLERKETATKAFESAKALYDFNVDELRKNQHDPELQRHVRDSEVEAHRTHRDMVAAHNAYMALPEETFSWRAGSAVKQAVMERGPLEERLKEARDKASAAAKEQRALRAGGDPKGAGEALRRSQEAEQVVRQTRAEMDALTKTDPKLSEQRQKREVPLSKAEIANAPQAPREDEADRQLGTKPGAARTPRSAESSSVVTSDPDTNVGTRAPARPPTTVPPPPPSQPPPAATTPVTRPKPLGPGEVGPGEDLGKVLNPVVVPKDPKERAAALQGPNGPAIARAIAAQNEQARATHMADAKRATKAYQDAKQGEPGPSTAAKAATTISPAPETTDGPVRPKSNVSATMTNTGAIEIKRPIGQQPATPGGDAPGEPAKVPTHATATVTVTGNTIGAAVTKPIATSPTGTTTSVTGGATIDAHGNVTIHGGVSFTGKSGSSLTPSFSHGKQVDASEPVEVDGQFEVTYSVTDSSSLGLGGEAKAMPGGPGIGGSIGASEAHAQSGVRRFKTKDEADVFRKNAALMIELSGGSEAPTTAAGALKIPIGETRASADTEGTNWGVSVSYGASVGYGQQKSTTNQLSVRRVSDNLVDVSAIVSRDKVKDWSISGGIGNTKGSGETKAFAVTFRFDLGTKEGRDAYDVYIKTGLPLSGGKLVSMTESKGEDDHDKVDVPLLGSAKWVGRTYESATTDDKGVHKQFGGAQTHDQDPSWAGKHIFGQDELHSSAEMVSRQEDGKEAGYNAVVKVKSDSGDYNREQFGQIFMGARGGVNVKPSGEWTLSADISKLVVHDLEKNSQRFRGATTDDEKMRVVSELMKENGARMAGGMVRSGANSKLAWSLELKGDENFPGPAGRNKLEEQRKRLNAALKGAPDTGSAIASEAEETLKKLNARREAVADPKRYTDLPDELRQQQLGLVDDHIAHLKGIRQGALSLALKGKGGEKIEDVRARMAKKHAYDQPNADQRDLAKLQDHVADKIASTVAIRKEVRTKSKALGDAIGPKGSVAVRLGLDSKTVGEHQSAAMANIRLATEMDQKQAGLDKKIDELREAAAAAASKEPKDQVEAMRALDKALDERLKYLQMVIHYIEAAAKDVVPITTRNAMSGNPAFWASVGGGAEEPREAPGYTPMALPK